MNDYWDGPRLGVADVLAVPHIYASPLNTVKNDFEEFYLVSPIDPALLDLVLEDWDIWMRWAEAFGKGETSKETHPALPADRPRHEQLKSLIGTCLVVDTKSCKRLTGEFRLGRPARCLGDGLEVRWSEADAVIEASPTPPHQCELD